MNSFEDPCVLILFVEELDFLCLLSEIFWAELKSLPGVNYGASEFSCLLL